MGDLRQLPKKQPWCVSREHSKGGISGKFNPHEKTQGFEPARTNWTFTLVNPTPKLRFDLSEELVGALDTP